MKIALVNEVNSPWLEMTDCGAKIGALPNEDGGQSIQAHEKDEGSSWGSTQVFLISTSPAKRRAWHLVKPQWLDIVSKTI